MRPRARHGGAQRRRRRRELRRLQALHAPTSCWPPRPAAPATAPSARRRWPGACVAAGDTAAPWQPLRARCARSPRRCERGAATCATARSSTAQRAQLYTDEYSRCVAVSLGPSVIEPGAPLGATLLDRMLEVDVGVYLPGDLLIKIDIATMAYSLEARSPLLDHELMELAASLPAELKARARPPSGSCAGAARVAPGRDPGRPQAGLRLPVAVVPGGAARLRPRGAARPRERLPRLVPAARGAGAAGGPLQPASGSRPRHLDAADARALVSRGVGPRGGRPVHVGVHHRVRHARTAPGPSLRA